MTGPAGNDAVQKYEDRYAVKRLSSVGSQDTMKKSHEDGQCIEVQGPPRTSFAHTATTSLGETVEMVPEHCLGQAK